MRAVDREPAEDRKRGARFAKRRERILHGLAKFGQAAARGVQPDQGGEGGLVLGGVLARGLAKGPAFAFDVQQVVADLERYADVESGAL